jgi:hypothetical protein
LIRKYVFGVMAASAGEYEAKLLVGKAIPSAESTYLQRLEETLLEKYKKLAYQYLNLNGHREVRESKIGDLEKKMENQTKVLDALQSENVDLKTRMNWLQSFTMRLLKPQLKAEIKAHQPELSEEEANRIVEGIATHGGVYRGVNDPQIMRDLEEIRRRESKKP